MGKNISTLTIKYHRFINIVRSIQYLFTHLIRLSTCFSDLSNDDISVNISVYFWITLYSNKAVLLAVIEPMPCSTCSDYPLKLIGLDPDDLLTTLVPPEFQTATRLSIIIFLKNCLIKGSGFSMQQTLALLSVHWVGYMNPILLTLLN